MFGGSFFGGSPFGSLIRKLITAFISYRDSEARGLEDVNSYRDSEQLGSIPLRIARNYHILIKDENGDFIGEFDKFRNLNFGKRLNNYGTASFDVLANDQKAADLISLRRYTVWIYEEEDDDTTLVWAGEQAARQGKLTDSGNNWVTIICFDWLEQLNARYTADQVDFTSEDAGQIAWDLIDTTQGETHGDMGITEGSIAVTIDRDRTYYNQNIMEAIINLSNVLSGFDFEITNNKVFNVYQTKGTDLTEDVILQYGINITTCSIMEDFVKPVNRAIVLGEATGETSLQRVEVEDSGSQTSYGLREGLLSETDVSELDTLTDKGSAMLRKFAQPVLKIDCTLLKSSISVTSFSLGDLIRVIIKNGIYNIDAEYRIFEWSIQYNSDNSEQLQLILGTLLEEEI